MLESVSESLMSILCAEGPMTQRELIDRLADDGHPLTDDEFDEVWLGDELPLCAEIDVTDERIFVALDALMEGRVLTHRLTEAEVTGDFLEFLPDFLPLWTMLDVPPFDRLDGELFNEVLEDDDDESVRLELPLGTLASRSAGALVGIRVLRAGLQLEDLAQPAAPPTTELIDEVAELFEFEDALDLADLVRYLCVRHPELFVHPMIPIADLLDVFGLDRSGDFVAPAGTVFADEEQDAAAQFEMLVRAYGLSESEALVVLAFASQTEMAHHALHEWEEGGRPEELPAEFEINSLVPLLPTLANPAVAAAILGQCAGVDEHRTIVLRSILQPLLSRAPRRAQPAVQWLLGSCADRLGEISVAEAAWEKAIGLAPDFEPALRDLAALASDRGDAQRAVSLLHRAGAEADDTLLAMVSRFLTTERSDLGRNSPCWCGSGRKYKVCHLHDASHTIGERRDWLYHKIARWVQASAGRALMIELAEIRAEFRTEPTAMLDALVDPLVLDVAIFEGGGLTDFLNARGSLLPADEQMLAASWQTSQRSLFEVSAVQPGHGFTLRDIRTGDIHEVVERMGSRQAKVGDVLCTRLLDAGDASPAIFGGIEPVPDYLTAATLAMLDLQDRDEADPFRTVSVLSARFAPPTMRTAEGDPVVLCTATLAIPDDQLDALQAHLETEFGGHDNGVWSWMVPGDIGNRVLGMVTLRSDKWTVNAMCERRFDELLAKMADGAPGVTVLDQQRIPGGEAARSQVGNDGVESPSRPDADDPALQEALAEFTRQYEQKWLDDSIPALGGATPRQVADDPTRRGDLIRLLDSFDDMSGGPGTMNVARLRAELGLDVDAATS